MRKHKSVLENESHKILWDWKVAHQIPVRKPVLALTRRKKCLVSFSVPANYRDILKKKL